MRRELKLRLPKVLGETVVAEYVAGGKVENILEEYNIDRKTLRRWVVATGFARRRPGRPRKEGTR